MILRICWTLIEKVSSFTRSICHSWATCYHVLRKRLAAVMLSINVCLLFISHKVKKTWICTALSCNSLASKALRYDTCYTRVHTVLPATKHEPYLPLLPSHRASLPFGRQSLRQPMEGWLGWVNLGGWLDQINFPHQELNLLNCFHVWLKCTDLYHNDLTIIYIYFISQRMQHTTQHNTP